MNKLKENKELILFESKRIRRKEIDGEWYYSIVDIIEILTESKDGSAYWRKLKQRLNQENCEVVTNCHRLKLLAKDGKIRETDCATRKTVFRIIQSVPSPNAEPFKLWFSHLAEERIQEIENPELAYNRAREIYKKKGYSDEWINARLKGIPVRKELVANWKERGATEEEFSVLTDELSKSTFEITTEEHKKIKNLTKESNLRDNMSPLELSLTTLAEVTTTEIHKSKNSNGFNELKEDAHIGGQVANNARKNIEEIIDKKVVTKENKLAFTNNKKLN